MSAPYPYRINPDGSVTVWLPRNVTVVHTDDNGHVRERVVKYAVRTPNGDIRWIQQGYKTGSDYSPA